MGVVYLAEDIKLERKVAIKFLPQHLTKDKENAERFEREAKAAASLNHPNIVTIHEIAEENDQIFIVMEYVEGKSLRDIIDTSSHFPIPNYIDIIIKIIEGLSQAHQDGIVHRDIKPENIIIDKDARVKILDFGLAKLKGVTKLTKDSSTVGTIHYMSPEQTRGESVDHRSDIWSLGVILYEMLTGQLAFKGDYEQAVIYSILNEDPQTISSLHTDIPIEFERIVNKSLAKRLNERYQHLGEVLVDLNAIFVQTSDCNQNKENPAGMPDKRNSIAVLPFVNVSSDKENEYFSDGITEELINALSKLKEIKVVSRTSVFQFKGNPYDIREIGKSLNVDTALEGSVRKAGDKLRITAQLINVGDGCHMWSESYNRDMKDVFVIQEEISNAIVNKLKIELSTETDALVVKRYTDNLEAYDLYLKGRFFWNSRQFSELEKAKPHFEKAIKMDSEYALAYAGLADYYNMMGFYAYSAPKEVIPKAKQAALSALEIDNTLAEAHSALAYARWTFDWDMKAAETGFKRAIELNPNYSTAHMWYSNFLVLSGRTEEGLAEIEKALSLDPLSLTIKACSGSMFYFSGQYARAVTQCSNTLDMNPNFLLARYILTLSYEQQSKYIDAIQEGIKIRELADSPQYIVSLAYAYAKSSKTAEANQLLKELLKLSKYKYVSGYHIAAIYSGLNQIDSAFTWLEKAIEERSASAIVLKVDPMFKNLHNDSRFNNMLKRIGLEK
jgi:serine/threonine-protein kinase